mmetsp:Transcript_101298/g.291816  ORF Transcript_101298/g.291816 Transcript_101298/m.291816 type:complete len:238 (-) Transcript_101298:747-1460(-)
MASDTAEVLFASLLPDPQDCFGHEHRRAKGLKQKPPKMVRLAVDADAHGRYVHENYDRNGVVQPLLPKLRVCWGGCHGPRMLHPLVAIVVSGPANRGHDDLVHSHDFKGVNEVDCATERVMILPDGFCVGHQQQIQQNIEIDCSRRTIFNRRDIAKNTIVPEDKMGVFHPCNHVFDFHQGDVVAVAPLPQYLDKVRRMNSFLLRRQMEHVPNSFLLSRAKVVPPLDSRNQVAVGTQV